MYARPTREDNTRGLHARPTERDRQFHDCFIQLLLEKILFLEIWALDVLYVFLLFFSYRCFSCKNYFFSLVLLNLQINSYQGYGRQFIRLALMKRLLPYTVQTLTANSTVLKVLKLL